jgi:hypothetical protein
VYFLLVYDRKAGALLDERAFDSRSGALKARFEVEKRYRDEQNNIEVVVVGASSREALKRTHGRYFLTLGQLADRTSAAVH